VPDGEEISATDGVACLSPGHGELAEVTMPPSITSLELGQEAVFVGMSSLTADASRKVRNP
jgi:hypothetical protein